jgi:hypothetical protein
MSIGMVPHAPPEGTGRADRHVALTSAYLRIPPWKKDWCAVAETKTAEVGCPENGESNLSATALYIKAAPAGSEWSCRPPFEDWLKMS